MQASSAASSVGHFACSADLTCGKVSGAGLDECDPALGCGADFHAACDGAACKIFPGPGGILCSSNQDCAATKTTHLVCGSDLSCKEVPGDGIDECDPAFGCGADFHAVCAGTTCKVLPGPGGLLCKTGADCSSSPLPPLVAAASVCGNGILESPEECDDGNRRSSDGCSESCLLEIGICGDGKVQALLGEQCESSTFDASLPYACKHCRFSSPTCGNKTVDPGEECDDGAKNSTSPNAHCRPDCSLSRCGDGIKDTGETCDDGNKKNDDGCDSSCLKEVTGGENSAVSSASSKATMVAADTPSYTQNVAFPQYPGNQVAPAYQGNPAQAYPNYPAYQNFQPVPYQLPLAQLQPLMMQTPRTTQSGPAAVAVIGAGAAAGLSWVRRKRK